ncbi:hypothetical protein D3C81_1595950 [compost metagenome]
MAIATAAIIEDSTATSDRKRSARSSVARICGWPDSSDSIRVLRSLRRPISSCAHFWYAAPAASGPATSSR